MPAKVPATLEVRSRAQWRRWLQAHHDSVREIWLVFRKGEAAARAVDYEAAIEEALCFGWVDSLVRRLDGERYARKFTPSRRESRWSTINRRRYADLDARGGGRAGSGAQAGAEVTRAPMPLPGSAPVAHSSALTRRNTSSSVRS